jgi:ABC-type transport system involved in multi-copper enzyme maturation permease subunit
MSTLAATATPAPSEVRAVTFRRVLRSESTKLRSLRSTRWSLGAAVVMMIAVPALVAAAQMSRWAHLSPHDRLTYDSINTAASGFNLAQLAIGVIGVLVISGEYSTGMIRSTLMAVPRRLPVLWAKVLVFAAITFALMLASSFVAFLITQAIVTQHHLQHALGDPNALRVVIGAALYLTALGVLAVGLGALLRNTAGGIAVFVLLLFVLPGVTAILPSSLGDAISPYLPLTAGTAIATSTFESPHHLAPWAGFALLCGYTAFVLIAAAFALKRRDA